ncbi:hypothetical protein DS745_02110 [Anaerobacillus alkaliphilus]|uniref:Uncharacterized protein n=1 Tax=Anaerobacillus alkaliphilus TaxID=1548597 RepID=A0A4Q0VWV5_9BACI|nr:hypothetical protein [Anaerobacillus alkaliphilus]RXJ04203.1 hypothetical protein DS745_02110 [Anaerobacillus alkaliphilus]
MDIFSKLITAFISAIILSLILSYMNYTPLPQQQEGIGYWSFSGLLQVYLLYSLPVFLFGGVTFSMFVDFIYNKLSIANQIINYLLKLVCYATGGLVIMGVLVLPGNSIASLEPVPYLILGIISALLFLHVNIGTEKVLEKIVN